MFFKVITTNLAAVVYLDEQRSQTEQKQLTALFTDKIDHKELAKAFPPGLAQAAAAQVLLRKQLVGKWAGDMDGYTKANPDSKDDVASLHRVFEYEFTEDEMLSGSIFDFDLSKLKVKYKLLREEKGLVVLQTEPTGFRGGKEVQIVSRQAEVAFTDKDHIRIIWTDKEGEKEKGKKAGLYLKRVLPK